MQKKLTFILMLVSFVLLMTACSSGNEPTQKGTPIEDGSVAEEAYQVIKKNNDAMNEEDLEAFAATYVEDMREEAREQMTIAIQETEFEHELSSPKVMEESDDRVMLSVIQTSTDLTGENEKIEDIVEHELVRENGEFKIKMSRPAQ